jgi:hypothetical protein
LDRARIEEVLATDADARAIHAEYERLNGVLKTSMPMPEMAWDEFSTRVSAETAKLDVPVRHYKLRFATVSKVAALAAMVAIIVGAIVTLRPQGPTISVGPGNSVAVNTTPIDVQVSAPPAVAAAAVSDIQIGQPSGLASVDYHSSEAIISAPSSIWIASGTNSAQDTDPSLY